MIVYIHPHISHILSTYYCALYVCTSQPYTRHSDPCRVHFTSVWVTVTSARFSSVTSVTVSIQNSLVGILDTVIVRDRPICDYPLSFNHCLWTWSKTDVNRRCFSVRGFGNRITREHLWSHVKQHHRPDAIRSESRARYDIIGYDSILGHANIHEDPSTGHMLHTLQIVW